VFITAPFGERLTVEEREMYTRYFALIIGIIFLLVGLMGFIPGIVQPPAAGEPVPLVNTLYGYLLGIFPVNILHSIVHLIVGVLGIVSYRSYDGARNFSRGLAIFYALLAIMGLIPGLNTTFGLIPIFGNDVWLHAVTAIIAAFFGFMMPRPVADVTAPSDVSPRL
jgi:hypothetical protein